MKHVDMYVNGNALKNPGASGSGIVIVCENVSKEYLVPLGNATNNLAEIEAVIYGLDQLKKPCEVTVYSCSQWLVKCANGEWQKNKYPDKWAKILSRGAIHNISFQWIRKNRSDYLKQASALANEAANESALLLEGQA